MRLGNQPGLGDDYRLESSRAGGRQPRDEVNYHAYGTAVTATWVQWPFTAIFAALAVFSAMRLITTRYGDISRLTRPDSCDMSPYRSGERSLDVSRGVMSVGMVAMMVPRIDPLPRMCWQVLFGVAAAHIAVRLIKRSVRPGSPPCPDELCGHELHLVIGGLAMVYMLAAMPAGQAMAGGMDMTAMGSTGLALPVLTWAFIAYFLVFAVRLSARLAVPINTPLNAPLNTMVTAPAGAGGPRGVIISPHLLGCAEVVMGIGMSYMLMTML